MTSGASDQERKKVRELVAEGLDALDAGGDTAYAEFLARHPDRADAIRGLVDELRESGLVGPQPGEPDVEVPEQLGDFKLLRRLGSGGMGVVWLARQLSLKREVALKLLHPSQLYFPGAHERFRREYETVARLDHPGIVPIHAVGEEAGVPYFAMERIVGASLAELLQALQGRDVRRLGGGDLRAALESVCGTAVDPVALGAFAGTWTQTVLRTVLQVGQALAHAHARGVLHRDVKPSNVMLGCDGRARLVDFGLARLDGASRLTRTGANPGSLPYMSPEQIDGPADRIDARTDVYALGVTLYELLTLRPAFAHESSEVTRRRILAGDTPPPRRLHRSLGREVETVCLTAMQVDAAHRYGAAAALVDDLENLLEGRPIAALRGGPLRAAASFARRRPTAVLAAVCLLCVAAGGVFLQQWHGASQREHFQRALREVLTAGFESRAPAAADLELVAAALPDAHQRRALELLTGDPLSKERWHEIRMLLPEKMRGPTGDGEEPVSGPEAPAPAPPAATAEVDRTLATLATSGDPILDGLLRAALLLELGRADEALTALERLPPDLAGSAATQRLQLEGRARALLQDATGVARLGAKAAALRHRRGG